MTNYQKFIEKESFISNGKKYMIINHHNPDADELHKETCFNIDSLDIDGHIEFTKNNLNKYCKIDVYSETTENEIYKAISFIRIIWMLTSELQLKVDGKDYNFTAIWCIFTEKFLIDYYKLIPLFTIHDKKLNDEVERMTEKGISRACKVCKLPYILNKKCSRCQKVYYCSTECQKKDWQNHKKDCQALLL